MFIEIILYLVIYREELNKIFTGMIKTPKQSNVLNNANTVYV